MTLTASCHIGGRESLRLSFTGTPIDGLQHHAYAGTEYYVGAAFIWTGRATRIDSCTVKAPRSLHASCALLFHRDQKQPALGAAIGGPLRIPNVVEQSLPAPIRGPKTNPDQLVLRCTPTKLGRFTMTGVTLYYSDQSGRKGHVFIKTTAGLEVTAQGLDPKATFGRD